MLKSPDSLFESDPRYRDQVIVDAGGYRPIGIQDLRDMIAPIGLDQTVPATIREQFDVARNAFVYSWFVFEFATLAEQQCYAILEMALRHRLDPAVPPNTSRSPGLDKLLKTAIARGWLARDDFLMPSFSGSGATMCGLDMIPMFRNHLMHGNIHLLPHGTPDVMRLCANVINKLFAFRPMP